MTGMCLVDAGGEFLHGHDQRAVAGQADDVLVGLCDLRAERGRQPEAHRAEPAGVDPLARAREAVVLGCPHLVLADVGRDDRLAVGGLVHRLDHVLRLDLGVDRVLVAERVLLLPAPDARKPALEPRAVRAQRAVLGGELGEDVLRVPHDRDVGRHVLRDLGRIDIDVDELRARRELGQLARHAVVEAGADAQRSDPPRPWRSSRPAYRACRACRATARCRRGRPRAPSACR